MERLMDEGLEQTIERVSALLAVLSKEAQRALRGECEFGAENVRQLRAPIEEMAPIVARYAELRRFQPETADAIDVYRSQLNELRATIAQIKVMLLGRRSQLEANRSHFQSVSQWAEALGQTR
jgi:hypothetical protein